ncbi:MAG: serine acetyltransferase [Oscillospiraceae bacterium]|nr:serine acetyltransferase [Oscillospiraceae bacterium]
MHPYGITVNPNANLGENVTLFKGATIGSIRSGNRAGTPVIGDRVVIGLNSTVVGNITVGNDVFIAPNTFVNFDVPDNSLVIGSPACIKNKINASKDYLSGG